MQGKMNRGALLAFVMVWAVLALAACSRGPTKLEVTATDMQFTPLEWTMPAGGEVELTLINNGALEHEWVLIKQGEEVTVPFDDDDEAKVFWEIEAEPGETVVGTFTAPTEPGTYTVVCGTAGHIEGGMVASATVE